MFSLVIPVFRNEASIPDLLDAVDGIGRELQDKLEVVFVDDGSPDRSYELLREGLATRTFDSRLMRHSRNFGSFAAIRTGLSHARGQYFAVMAADLQEPPELIVAIFRRLAEGSCDVVLGVREGRNDPVLARAASSLFWRIFRAVVQPDLPPGGADVFGCNEVFRGKLGELPETHSSLIGLSCWLGFRRSYIGYERKARRHGKSAWTLRKKLDYFLDSMFSFTDLPVKLLLMAGTVGLLMASVWSAVVLYARISGQITVPGYSTTLIVILLFGALNSLGLGIIGSYVWRIFMNVNRRPEAVVMSVEDVDSVNVDGQGTRN